MVGAIRRLEVLSHPLVTIECFGWVVFFRAVFTWQDRTFLSLLNTAKVFQRTTMPVPEFIGRCVALEQRAMWIYRSLAVRYSRVGDVRDFFNQLADQEEVHAELLELCRVAASRGRWRQQNLDAWQRSAADTEGLLAEAERRLDGRDSLADSLRLVIRMESSQINGLFMNVVNATDARFAKVYSAFCNAVRDHLGYLQEQIPILEPSLAAECDQLQVRS